jgi:hypothetical protein
MKTNRALTTSFVCGVKSVSCIVSISYHSDTDNDIEKLIERTEKEGDKEEPEKKEGLSFAFAKIWAADKDTLEEMADDTAQGNDKDDSWAQTLAVRV